MNRINFKYILLPITLITATLISACDNDKDTKAEAEKNQEKYMQEIRQKEHQQSMFFYDNAEMQKAISDIIAKGGTNLAVIEVRFFKGGYSFILQSTNDPAKVEMFKFNNGSWGGPSPVNLTIFGVSTDSQKEDALKEALFKFDSINFSVIPERIQDAINRANTSGIITVTEDSDIVVRAEIAHNGKFVYDITITAENTGHAVMTLNKDGSIAGYETKEPFDPKKEMEKAQKLVEQSRKNVEDQRQKAAQKMNEIQQTFQK